MNLGHWWESGKEQKLPSVKTLATAVMVRLSVVQYGSGCVCVGSGSTLQVQVKLPSVKTLAINYCNGSGFLWSNTAAAACVLVLVVHCRFKSSSHLSRLVIVVAFMIQHP